jgi:hypothetical protein
VTPPPRSAPRLLLIGVGAGVLTVSGTAGRRRVVDARGPVGVRRCLAFGPALLAPLAALRSDRPTQLRAGLSTAVVSLPLLALGWSLLTAPRGVASAVAGGLYSAAVFGVVPLVLGLLVGARSPAE